MLKGFGINVEILAPDLGRAGAICVGHYGGRTTILVSRGPLALRERLLKRAFDLAVAIPAILLLAPVIAAIALAIRLDSAGPIVFRQPRVGLGNRLFEMVKFRTMHAEALDRDGSRHTLAGDSRVTPVGAFLRRTSLDELPQLFNVLRGEMSIAGPRPHPLGALAGGSLFWKVDDRYWHRHAVKPGMTGLAQVRGLRGSTFHPADLRNRLQADLEYLAGWSIWRDVAILCATARVMVHRNAF
jgi:lipopolysaccharide/colanic/teichoic acid biosynthesis glycosyltransferase